MDRKSEKSSNKRADRTTKRRFHGNQNTVEADTTHTSASARKISKGDPDFSVTVDQTLRYFIVNFTLFTLLQQDVICKVCQKDVKYGIRGQKGLGFYLSKQCKCEEERSYPSSPEIGNTFEINRRFVFVMRMLGIGFQGINKFLGLMDFGGSLTKNAYYYIVEQIWTAVTAVTKKVFEKAAKEEQEKNKNSNKNFFTVSGDGTWAKRGFSSLVGVASLIGKFSGKILDLIVKSSVCKACEKWAGKEDTVEYEIWYEKHEPECNANHQGSAGLMEVNSIIEMFQRSVEYFKVYYKYYIGDGDTKTFKSLLDKEPYGDECKIEKKECVLHVKKRMYKRVKDAKKQFTQLKKAKKQLEEKAKKAEEAKQKKSKKTTVTSTKRKTVVKAVKKDKVVTLTNKLMQDLSLYYGLAVLNNSDSVENMRKAIWATFYHKISTDAKPQHSHCPVDGWCDYRKAEAANTLKDYKHPPALEKDTQDLLKPIYEDLTSEDLLQRCVGANTQNNNESFNSCIWQIAPKHIFSGKKIVEIAAYTAACKFNEGFEPLLKIMAAMGVPIGVTAKQFVQKQDEARILVSNRRSEEASKEHRVALRNARLEENEKYEEAEGIMYGAGIAD